MVSAYSVPNFEAITLKDYTGYIRISFNMAGPTLGSKIFGPVWVGDDFRIRFNSELYELLNDIDLVQRINIQRLSWLGHVVRMEEDASARRVYDAGICGNRQRVRICICWKTKPRKPCHWLVQPTGVGAQKAEMPGRMCCGRPKSVNRIVMAN